MEIGKIEELNREPARGTVVEMPMPRIPVEITVPPTVAPTEMPGPVLSWRTRTAIRILMAVAEMIADDDHARHKIGVLAAHLNVGGGRD
jgi:hypothetical protein